MHIHSGPGEGNMEINITVLQKVAVSEFLGGGVH